VRVAPQDPEAAAAAKAKRAESAKGENGEAADVEDEIEYEKQTTLYKRSDYLGQKKTIHLSYDVNMHIEATAIYPDGTEELLTTWDLDFGPVMSKDVMQKETTSRPKVSLAFELSRSHLFLLHSAKINVEEKVLEEVVKEAVKPKKEEKADEEEKKTDDDLKAEKSDETSDAQPEETATSPSSDAAEAKNEVEEKSEPEKEYKEKIVPHQFNIDNLGRKLVGLRLLTEDQKKAAGKKIKALGQRDKDKILADEAKNAYEALIYELKDFFGDEENNKYVSETNKEKILKSLEEGEEWLYDAGAQESHTKYQERSYDLIKERTKLLKRKDEHKLREEKIPPLLE